MRPYKSSISNTTKNKMLWLCEKNSINKINISHIKDDYGESRQIRKSFKIKISHPNMHFFHRGWYWYLILSLFLHLITPNIGGNVRGVWHYNIHTPHKQTVPLLIMNDLVVFFFSRIGHPSLFNQGLWSLKTHTATSYLTALINNVCPEMTCNHPGGGLCFLLTDGLISPLLFVSSVQGRDNTSLVLLCSCY